MENEDDIVPQTPEENELPAFMPDVPKGDPTDPKAGQICSLVEAA